MCQMVHGRKKKSWNYFAATVEAANRDFLTWQNDGDDWKGTNGKEFQRAEKQVYGAKKGGFYVNKIRILSIFKHI